MLLLLLVGGTGAREVAVACVERPFGIVKRLLWILGGRRKGCGRWSGRCRKLPGLNIRIRHRVECVCFS